MKRLFFVLMITSSIVMSAQSVSVVDTQFYADNYDFVVLVSSGPSDSVFINGMRIPSPLFRGANYGTTYVITLGSSSSSDTLCIYNPPAFTMPAVTFLTDSSFMFDVPPFPFFLDPFKINIINDTLISPYNVETRPSSGMTKKISHGGSIKNVLIEHDLLPTGGILFSNPYYVEDTVYIHDTIIVQLPVHDTTFVYQPLPHHLLDVIPSPAELGIAVGSGTFVDSTTVEIAGIPVAGNHFVQWSDGSTENPRHVMVCEDMELIAFFAPDEVGITDVPSSSVNITVHSNIITVQGVEGQRVRVFDSVGRMLSTTYCPNNSHSFRFSVAGVYLVQVGNHPAHRVVVNWRPQKNKNLVQGSLDEVLRLEKIFLIFFSFSYIDFYHLFIIFWEL